MPLNVASCLLKDFVYQQDKETQYVFSGDNFVLVDRDEVADSILRSIDGIFEKYFGKDEKLSVINRKGL
jgi:Zn-finger protein